MLESSHSSFRVAIDRRNQCAGRLRARGWRLSWHSFRLTADGGNPPSQLRPHRSRGRNPIRFLARWAVGRRGRARTAPRVLAGRVWRAGGGPPRPLDRVVCRWSTAARRTGRTCRAPNGRWPLFSRTSSTHRVGRITAPSGEGRPTLLDSMEIRSSGATTTRIGVEFVGTALALALSEYESRCARVSRGHRAALRLAVEGTLERDLHARYSNIALMSAFLRWFAGVRLGQAAWIENARTARGGDRWTVSRERGARRIQLADVLRRRSVRARTLALVRPPPGCDTPAPRWKPCVARHRPLLPRGDARRRRAVRPRLRDGYAPLLASLGIWIWLTTGYATAPVPDLDEPFPTPGISASRRSSRSPAPACLPTYAVICLTSRASAGFGSASIKTAWRRPGSVLGG